ncbi:cardiolipin synthase [Paraburkholderia youngii]
MSAGGSGRLARLRHTLLGRRYFQRYRFTGNNQVELLRSGDDFFDALIERIDAAEHSVALETYIFCDDEAGHAVSEALLRAAARGVRVRVITDGIGTARLKMFEQWPAGGIEHRIYNPHLFGRFGFSRTHRKLAVIDDRIAYCGGINIVDDFENNGEKLPYHRWDFAVELRGPVVADVRDAIEVQWRRIRLGHRPLDSFRPDVSSQDANSLGSLRRRRRRRNEELWAGGEPCVAFVARDNLINRRAIEKAYLAAIGQARHEILLANPYFMPGRKLRRALVFAARRGVVVKLIIGRKEFKALDYAGAVPVPRTAARGRADRRIREDAAARQGRGGRFELGHGRFVESRCAQPDAQQRSERRARQRSVDRETSRCDSRCVHGRAPDR